jgi:hypothetical protein
LSTLEDSIKNSDWFAILQAKIVAAKSDSTIDVEKIKWIIQTKVDEIKSKIGGDSLVSLSLEDSIKSSDWFSEIQDKIEAAQDSNDVDIDDVRSSIQSKIEEIYTKIGDSTVSLSIEDNITDAVKAAKLAKLQAKI